MGLREFILKQVEQEDRERLRTKTDEELKLLWDRYDGTNRPDGFTGEDIHHVLGERGLQKYCAV